MACPSSQSTTASHTDETHQHHSSHIIDYKLPPPPWIRRIRPAAHLVDKNYIAKFEKAIQLMKSLAADDPRNFYNQANIPLAYSYGHAQSVEFIPEVKSKIQIENSWFYFPFYRWYLYFFERILGKLINDPTFAIPFWNWDNPAGMTMPAMYLDPSSSLYDKNRNQNHLPPAVVNLNYSGKDSTTVTSLTGHGDKLIADNLAIMYRTMITNGKSAEVFMGRRFDTHSSGGGSLENTGTNNIHVWSGDPSNPFSEDMGNFYSSGRDVIFYGLHANVDRMWDVWTKTPGHQNFNDVEWLNAAFYLYDENKHIARVRVSDCLESEKLGYGYETKKLPWKSSNPVPRVTKSRVAYTSGAPLADEVFPLTLDKTVKVVVLRQLSGRRRTYEERLVVSGIDFDADKFAKYDIYINDEEDNPNIINKGEFLGSFSNLPHKSNGETVQVKITQSFVLNDILKDLQVEHDDRLLLTVVPKTESRIKIGGVKISYFPILHSTDDQCVD